MCIIYDPGRDLEHAGGASGTWLGVNKRGRFSVLTNWRKPVGAPILDGALSRG